MQYLYVYDYHYAITKLVKELVGLLYDLKYVYDMERDEMEIEKRRGYILLYMRLVRDIGGDPWGLWGILAQMDSEIAQIEFYELWRSIGKLLAAVSESKAIITDPMWPFSKRFLESPEALRTLLSTYTPESLHERECITVQQGAFLCAFCRNSSPYMFEKVKAVFQSPTENREILLESDVLGDVGFPVHGQCSQNNACPKRILKRVTSHGVCHDPEPCQNNETANNSDFEANKRKWESERYELLKQIHELQERNNSMKQEHENREKTLHEQCHILSEQIREIQENRCAAGNCSNSGMFNSRHSDGSLAFSTHSMDSSQLQEQFSQMGNSLRQIQDQVRRLSDILKKQ